MKSKFDPKLIAHGKSTAAAAKKNGVEGGKALQRLLSYLGERDPVINDDVLAFVHLAKKARPRFEITTRARNLGLPTPRSLKARRVKKKPPASKKLATALAKAAARLPGAATAAPAALVVPQWQELGPNRIPNGQTYGSNRIDVIGRVSSIAIDRNATSHVLLGTAGGGIWESGDAGSTWVPRTDHLPSLAIGALAFDPQNTNVVYAGSGEGNFYFNLGAGVYKSTDGGANWAVIASAPFLGVGFFKLTVDSANSNVIYAATTDGIYKSTNAGVTWTQKRAGRCWDLSLHSSGGPNAEILAAFEDGLFVSTNGGSTFAAVTLPLNPSGVWSRLAVDRTESAPDVAYVFGAKGDAAYLWRRSGTVWTRISIPAGINVKQAWYDWYVAADPNAPGTVYIGAIDTYRCKLAGPTGVWVNITTQGSNSIHPDQHCLSFVPGNSQIIYLGNDGGIFVSNNAGSNWKPLNKGLGITEVEYLAADPNTSNWIMAGTQDNGTIGYAGSTVWNHLADGDGGDCGVNQLNPNIVFHSFFNVSLQRSTDKGLTWSNLSPPAMASLFYPPVEVFGTTVAIAGVSLAISRNSGSSWSTVPLNLTPNDVATAMRIVDTDSLFIATRLGNVRLARWSGANWTISNLSSPTPRNISCIATDLSNAQRLWVTLSQIQSGAGMVYRSDNGGSNWIQASSGLPRIPFNAVVVDPANGNRIWVGADVGVYQSLDAGVSWIPFSNGLPNAMAVDLIIHNADRKLICATRNRGAWVIKIP